MKILLSGYIDHHAGGMVDIKQLHSLGSMLRSPEPLFIIPMFQDLNNAVQTKEKFLRGENR